jgi:tetratricopeptide (TPR) repeat protein
MRAAALFALAVALLCGGARAQPPQPEWWNGRWRQRMLVTVARRPDAPDVGAACLWAHLPVGADRGGQDIRVVGPDGSPVPFGIAGSTPDGRYLVAFQTPQRQGYYAVYFDNPQAGPANYELPQVGLIYETRPLPEGADAGNWTAAQAAIGKSGPPYGASYWNQVFDGVNPFGPQSDYIATYRGYIRCTKAGRYGFATLSDHSSFLLVDDQMVTQWIGPHNIFRGRQGEQSGTIDLEAGVHKFLYVHFAFGGPARAAAAWMLPGESRWEIVPQSAFTPPAEARVYESQRFGQPLCAEFISAAQSYCEAGEAKMVAVRFESRSSVSLGTLVDRYEWDFGDGQTAADSQPVHVYLAPGTYTVTLAITTTAGQRASCSKLLSVQPLWADLNFTQRRLNRFLELVQQYHLEKLPTPSLLAAWAFFKDIEMKDMAFEAARLLDQRREELQPAQLYDVALALGKQYDEKESDPQLAEQYFELAFNTAPPGDLERRFGARFALCEHYYSRVGDLAKAREQYTRLRAEFPLTAPDRRRMALIRIGDTYRDEGKAAEALNAYQEAESDPAYQSKKPPALMAGAFVQEVESYLARGESDEAVKRLDELLWYYPTMRLRGQPALLRVQASLVKGNFKEAKKLADGYLRFGTDPDAVPAVHVAAADACTELGLLEEAAQHYRAVLKDFPESPQAQEADNGLRRLGQR